VTLLVWRCTACTAPGCAECFYWVCGRPLAKDAHALCAHCLNGSPTSVTAYEDASNGLVLLDAYLAARGLLREPVAADGFRLFAAVSRVTGRITEQLIQETMHT
jgi:hypothetical protein